MLTLVILTILIALLFDFSNGFHDAANSIATVVATRVLSPSQAVVWAAFFNFVAAFVFGVKVATTVGKGVVDPHAVNQWVILAAVLGALSWNILTWYFGLPTSSSHALQHAPPWVMPPQNLEHIPWWIIFAAYAAIALGTMSGGWRIVKTMGMRITALRPIGGFCAETGGAITLFLASSLGIPVSTTHTITGAIVGVGSVQRASAVRWGVAGTIVWAWIFTIPAAALVAGVCYWISFAIY